jgi:hypothetical protein
MIYGLFKWQRAMRLITTCADADELKKIYRGRVPKSSMVPPAKAKRHGRQGYVGEWRSVCASRLRGVSGKTKCTICAVPTTSG